MTDRTPTPDLIRGLPQPHETPDQVRGGVISNLNATLTEIRNPLQLQDNQILSTVDTP